METQLAGAATLQSSRPRRVATRLAVLGILHPRLLFQEDVHAVWPFSHLPSPLRSHSGMALSHAPTTPENASQRACSGCCSSSAATSSASHRSELHCMPRASRCVGSSHTGRLKKRASSSGTSSGPNLPRSSTREVQRIPPGHERPSVSQRCTAGRSFETGSAMFWR